MTRYTITGCFVLGNEERESTTVVWLEETDEAPWDTLRDAWFDEVAQELTPEEFWKVDKGMKYWDISAL